MRAGVPGAAAECGGGVSADCGGERRRCRTTCRRLRSTLKTRAGWRTFIASSLPFLSTTDKQDLLETPDVKARLEKLNGHLAKEIEVQQLRNKIQSEVQDSVQQSQRDYYLREQMKAIQKELGDQDDTQKDIAGVEGKD